MFRRIYLKLTSILLLSSVGLMTLLGGLVYMELNWQLQSRGETSLLTELPEVEEAVGAALVNPKSVLSLDFSDDRGQNVYFTAEDQGRLVLSSPDTPLSLTNLRGLGTDQGFQEIVFNGRPYRIYHEPWMRGGKVLDLYIYQMTAVDTEILTRVSRLMFEVGGFGLVLALLLSGALAKRAIRPAVRTWQAHQNMLVELSHELKTPLATIQAIAQTAIADPAPQQSIKREVEHATAMLSDILYLSKITSEPAVESEPVAVSDLTEDVTARFRPLTTAKGITLIGTAEPGIYVKTSIERWDRLCSTLLKNVVDHAKPDTPATWSLHTEGHVVSLVVENQVKAQQRLPEGANAGHRGFGLSIVRRLVSDMNGTVSVVQNADRARVTIRVPRIHPARP